VSLNSLEPEWSGVSGLPAYLVATLWLQVSLYRPRRPNRTYMTMVWMTLLRSARIASILSDGTSLMLIGEFFMVGPANACSFFMTSRRLGTATLGTFAPHEIGPDCPRSV
jgi:hypothetical protein